MHDRIVVKALGGTVGTITQVVLDGPQFAVGDRDLLFLVPSDEAGAYQLFGLGQGKVPVRRSTGAGRDLVRLPPPDGLQRSPGREAGVSSPSAPGRGRRERDCSRCNRSTECSGPFAATTAEGGR